VLAVAAVLWSLSIGATGLASGLRALRSARAPRRLGGPNFPALTGAVSRWLAPQERATALGNALVAVPLALAIGGPIVTQMLAWFDWRGTFFVLFGLSILWVPLWLFFYRDDPRQSRFVNQAELAISKARERHRSREPPRPSAKTGMPSASCSRTGPCLPTIGPISSTGTSCSSS